MNVSATVAVTMFYELATVSATGPTAVVTVAARRTAPVTLATLTATGGVATLQFAVAADALGGMSVGATSGVLVATLLPAFGRFVTATIRVGDGVQVNASATVAVTMFYALATVRATGPTGVVTVLAESVAPVTLATLSATGGVGDAAVCGGGGCAGGVVGGGDERGFGGDAVAGFWKLCDGDDSGGGWGAGECVDDGGGDGVSSAAGGDSPEFGELFDFAGLFRGGAYDDGDGWRRGLSL